ncbi:hypothetical protein ACLOJK_017941 [Asimina triloba]
MCSKKESKKQYHQNISRSRSQNCPKESANASLTEGRAVPMAAGGRGIGDRNPELLGVGFGKNELVMERGNRGQVPLRGCRRILLCFCKDGQTSVSFLHPRLKPANL